MGCFRLIFICVCLAAVFQPLYAIDHNNGPAQRIIVTLTDQAAASLRTKTVRNEKLAAWSRTFNLELKFVHEPGDSVWVLAVVPAQGQAQLDRLMALIANDRDVRHVEADRLMQILR